MNDYSATVRLCARTVGLPIPEAEYRLAPPRRWRFDFAWVPARILLEVEGGVYARKGAKRCPVCGQTPRGRHATASGFVRDVEKYNAAAGLGWLLFRATPQQVGDLTLWRQIRRAYDFREAA